MIERMQQDPTGCEPELAEILDLGNFQEAIELLVEKPLRSLSDDQRSHTDAGFEGLKEKLGDLDSRVCAWLTEVDSRLDGLKGLLESERSAGSQHEEASRQEASALTSAVARIQQDLDALRDQQGQLVFFAEAEGQQARSVADRDRLLSRLMFAALGILLVVLLVVEFVKT